MPRSYPYIKSFHINNDGINRIATGSRTSAAVRDIAVKAMRYAVSNSPEEHGQYKASFRVSLHIRRDWPHDTRYPVPRVCADLVNVHPGALWIEKGSVRRRKDGSQTVVPGHYVMTRTLAHLAIKGKP